MAERAIYDGDFAYVHDAGFGGFVRGAAPGLLRRLRRAGIRAGTVVDLGCGSGIWARTLTDAGYDALGIDASEDMLRIARERAPAARFVRASLFEAELPPCAAVTAIGEVLCYAAHGDDGWRRTVALLGRVEAALHPGGLLLFDVAVPGRERREPRRAWHEGEDWLLALEACEGPAGLELTRRMAVFRRTPTGWRRSDETHGLRLFEPRAMLAALEDAGFEARALRSYGREPFPRGLVAFAARKRRTGRG